MCSLSFLFSRSPIRKWREGRETHCAIRALPHLLEVELLHAGLVRRDRRTLNADLVLDDRLCGVNRHLVVCLPARISSYREPSAEHEQGKKADRVTVLEAKVVVFDVKLEIRKDDLRQRDVNVEVFAFPRGARALRTSSRIFFQMIRVISSPSSST
jgi:hypothetical protein